MSKVSHNIFVTSGCHNRKITSQLVLTLSKRERKFRVETDTSEHTIGEVLSQKQEGKWKLITFLSRTIQVAEKIMRYMTKNYWPQKKL